MLMNHLLWESEYANIKVGSKSNLDPDVRSLFSKPCSGGWVLLKHVLRHASAGVLSWRVVLANCACVLSCHFVLPCLDG